MSAKSQLKRRLAGSILLIALAIGVYYKLSDTEKLRMVYESALVLAGIGFGAFLTNFFTYARIKQQKQD